MPARARDGRSLVLPLLVLPLLAAGAVLLSAGAPAAESLREPSRWRADPSLDAAARTAGARERREAEVTRLLAAAGLGDAPDELFLVAYKKERLLEVWAGERGRPLRRVARYRLCAASGALGPKRREGDLQVPEGFYHVSGKNPRSRFHLALRVSYPNPSDRILGDRGRLGGDIMIHGGCASIGCLAVTDERIEEIWELARRVSSRVDVHIYPARDLGRLIASGAHPEHHDFWQNLAEGLARFEATRRPPRVRVARDGRYLFDD